MGTAAAIRQQHLCHARAFIMSPLCIISHLMHFYHNKPALLHLLNKPGWPRWSSNKYTDGTREKGNRPIEQRLRAKGRDQNVKWIWRQMTRESISSGERSYITHNVYAVPVLQIFISLCSFFPSFYLLCVWGTSSHVLQATSAVSIQCTQCITDALVFFGTLVGEKTSWTT